MINDLKTIRGRKPGGSTNLKKGKKPEDPSPL